MSKSSPSPPPAPDPQATASAQSGSNIATAIANAQLNRVNQTTPWGSISYTQGAPGANGVPTWSSQIQLSPQQQALLDQQQGMQLQRGQIAQGYLGQVGRTLDFSHLHPLNERGQMYAGAVNDPSNAQAMPAPQAHAAAPASTPSGQDLISQLLALFGNGNSNASPAAPAPATAPTASAQPSTGPSSGPLDQPTWGSSNGMLYQYGTDSRGQDMFGPGTAEDGTPLGNQDKSMIGHNDPRYAAAQQAMAQYGPNYTQVRVAQQGVPGGFKDRSLVKYDPTVGYVTPESNIVQGPDDTLARMLMVLAPAVGGMVAGAYTGAGLGGGEIAAGGGAAAGVGDGAAAGASGDGFAGLSSGVGNPYGAGAFESGGFAGTSLDPALAAAGTAGGAPVTDLSVQASHPSLFQQMGNNFTSGRGLLGLNPAQRAGVGLLPALLRGLQSGNNTGGSK